MSKNPRYFAIAERLKAELGTYSSGYLPAIIPLSARYGVSAQTMLKALHLLRDEGLLEIGQGKRVKILSGDAHNGGLSGIDARGSIDQLFNKVKAEILDCTIKKAQPLPKVKFYCLSEHISPNSVCEVFRRLEAEKLIHKKGKQWFAGIAQTPMVKVSQMPTVCIVAPSYETWRHYCGNVHTHPFAREFNSELDRCNVARTMAYAASVPQINMRMAVGIDETLSHAQALGDRFAGLFIPYGLEPVIDLKKWVSAFAHIGKPIVFFDHCNYRPHMVRSAFGYKNFWRLFYDEKDIASIALKTLHQAGHLHIGLTDILPSKEDEWVVARLKAIQRIAGEFNPPLSIVQEEQRSELWLDDDDTAYFVPKFISRLNAMIDSGKVPERNIQMRGRYIREQLAGQLPCLSNLLRKGVTAIIGINDWVAVNILLWLQELEIQVPEQVSLISFDNRPESQHYPISTIDFGYERLGFYAAHIFLGDVPVPADIEGQIVAAPRLIERGSIAPPRSESLRFAREFPAKKSLSSSPAA